MIIKQIIFFIGLYYISVSKSFIVNDFITCKSFIVNDFILLWESELLVIMLLNELL